MVEIVTRYPKFDKEQVRPALCTVTVSIAGRPRRVRGCKDTRKTSCVTHDSSGIQYLLWVGEDLFQASFPSLVLR